MNDVTVIFTNGDVEVFTQDNIVRPKFNCFWTAMDYTSKILELGLTTEIVQGDGSVETRKVSPYCLCQILFTKNCSE